MNYPDRQYKLSGKNYVFKVLGLYTNNIKNIPTAEGVYIVNERIKGAKSDLGEPLKINPTENLRQSAEHALNALQGQHPKGLIFEFFESENLLERTNVVAELSTYFNYFH